MFNAKALVVKSLMVVGSVLIPITDAVADIENPRFFEYRAGGFTNNLIEITFGWFRTLSEEQRSAYYESIMHAVMFAENGQKVTWYKDDASGMAMPAMTWPTGGGYCRRLHIQAIAYGKEKTMSRTACFNEVDNRWTWHN